MCGRYTLTFEEVKEIEDILVDILQPFPNDVMQAHVVSKAVGNVRNNFKELMEPSTLF